MGIENEIPAVQNLGDLIVACSYGAGETTALPFFKASKNFDYEGQLAGNAGPVSQRKWNIVAPSAITRRLTPSVDKYKGDNITLRVTSLRFALASPATRQGWNLSLLPAELIEVENDNTDHDVEARGFLGILRGIGAHPRGRLV